MSMISQAVIDRFEGKTAVLIVGEEERLMNIPRASLPKGSKEGDWLKIELDGEKLISVERDLGETENARKRIAGKVTSLLRRDRLK
jgi:hypothetical protein